MLVGGLLGLAVGGALTGIAPWAPFALAARARSAAHAADDRPASAEPEGAVAAEPKNDGRPVGYYLRAASRPGVRSFLLAQILWVLGYAALPAFFLLYAEEELGLERRQSRRSGSPASAWRPRGGDRRRRPRAEPAAAPPLLLAGVALLGSGFLGVAASTSLALVGAALLVGALGFGLISTLGFPLFSKLIPDGEAGGYTALYFSVRSISSTIALPAAGWTVAGHWELPFALRARRIATLAALVPLAGDPAPRGSRSRSHSRLLATGSGARPPRRADRRRTGPTSGCSAGSTASAPGPSSSGRSSTRTPATTSCSIVLAVAAAAAHRGSARSRACSRASWDRHCSRGGCSRRSTRSTTGRGRRRSSRDAASTATAGRTSTPSRAATWRSRPRSPSRSALAFPRLRVRAVGIRRRGRVHPCDVRRALPARRRRGNRARHRERPARRRGERVRGTRPEAARGGRAARRRRAGGRRDAGLQRCPVRRARRARRSSTSTGSCSSTTDRAPRSHAELDGLAAELERRARAAARAAAARARRCGPASSTSAGRRRRRARHRRRRTASGGVDPGVRRGRPGRRARDRRPVRRPRRDAVSPKAPRTGRRAGCSSSRPAARSATARTGCGSSAAARSRRFPQAATRPRRRTFAGA